MNSLDEALADLAQRYPAPHDSTAQIALGQALKELAAQYGAAAVFRAAGQWLGSAVTVARPALVTDSLVGQPTPRSTRSSVTRQRFV